MNPPKSLMLLFLGLAMVSCKSDDGEKRISDLWKNCERSSKPDPCLEWGRAILGRDLDSAVRGEREIEQAALIRNRFRTDEVVAIHGAVSVRAGGLFANEGEIVKGVELIDSGLNAMLEGMREFPESKALRLYYGNTLSYLPKDFMKGQEASDTLHALLLRFPMTATDSELVKGALARVSTK